MIAVHALYMNVGCLDWTCSYFVYTHMIHLQDDLKWQCRFPIDSGKHCDVSGSPLRPRNTKLHRHCVICTVPIWTTTNVSIVQTRTCKPLMSCLPVMDTWHNKSWVGCLHNHIKVVKQHSSIIVGDGMTIFSVRHEHLENTVTHATNGSTKCVCWYVSSFVH